MLVVRVITRCHGREIGVDVYPDFDKDRMLAEIAGARV